MKNIYIGLLIITFASCSNSLQIFTSNEELEPYYEIKFINKSLNPYEIYLPEGTFVNDLWIIDGKEKEAPFVIQYDPQQANKSINITTSHDNYTHEVINYSDSFIIGAISKKEIKFHLLNVDSKQDSILVNIVSRNSKDSLENIWFYLD